MTVRENFVHEKVPEAGWSDFGSFILIHRSQIIKYQRPTTCVQCNGNPEIVKYDVCMFKFIWMRSAYNRVGYINYII